MGTLIRVQLRSDPQAFELIYNAISEVEGCLSRYDGTSEVFKFNSGLRVFPSQIFREVLDFALAMRRVSNGAFSPFIEEQEGQLLSAQPIEMGRSILKLESCRLDLGGIAKGFAADYAVQALMSAYPDAAGSIEAGGDLRFFGDVRRKTILRLGCPPHVIIREILAPHAAVASSAPGFANQIGESKTYFRQTLAVPMGSTVTVFAEDAMTADAFTKIVLFSKEAANIAKRLGADFLIFDQLGKCQMELQNEN
jgi:thiamine biosynthesis lipoprotein